MKLRDHPGQFQTILTTAETARRVTDLGSFNTGVMQIYCGQIPRCK